LCRSWPAVERSVRREFEVRELSFGELRRGTLET